VAGCAGSRFRQLSLLLAVLTAAGGVAAQTSPAPQTAAVNASAPSADDKRAQRRQAKKMDKNTKVDNPDAALIEYLGEYGDAADGLDPMGLADPDVQSAKSGGGH
jgi:hypothetical protein